MPSLVDALGQRVEVPDEPRRIISLSPAVTEILFELGLGDNVVGVTPFCVRPPEAKKRKKVGSYGYVNTELFKSLEPDLILTVTGYQESVANQLRPMFHTFSFDLPSSLASVVELPVMVGLVAGRPERGREIEKDLLSRLGKVKRGKGGSVYLECDLGGPVTFGSLSYITDVLYFMNLRSIYHGATKEWLVPDFKFVEKEDPDFIILEPKMFSKRDGRLVARLMEERGWKNLRAYRNGTVFVTPGEYDFFAHHGPSLVREVIPWLEGISTKT
ncbi:MAG: ABC transporter substrate-binding protein [Thermoplasmata archaeon]